MDAPTIIARRIAQELRDGMLVNLGIGIPTLVANLFANAALSAAFVPVFTELLQRGRRREALRLASTLFWIMLIALGALTAVAIVSAGVVVPLFTGGKFNST